MNRIPLLTADATPQKIKEILGASLSEFIFDVDNGGVVVARTKVTVRSGLVRTKYLHLNVINPRGDWCLYREQSNGKFKVMDSGSAGSLNADYLPNGL